MRKLCAQPGCGAIVARGYCPRHGRAVPLRPQTDEERQWKLFYASTAWRNVRAAVLTRDNGVCQTCYRAGRATRAVEVHHKIRRRLDDSLALDPDNLEAICAECHDRETARERRDDRMRRRRRGN